MRKKIRPLIADPMVAFWSGINMNVSLLRRLCSRFKVQNLKMSISPNPLNLELPANYLPNARWISAIRPWICCLKSAEVGMTSDNACKCNS